MSKNDRKLIIGGFGIIMSWVEKNRKINNRGGGEIIRDSRVGVLKDFAKFTGNTFARVFFLIKLQASDLQLD